MDEGRLIRIGQVSSIDYDKNLIKVTYPDMDDAVTDDLPYFSFSDEYKMPGIGEDVLVVHLSTGSAGAVCLGKYWNEDNEPKKKGKDVWRKELALEAEEAYMQYCHDDREYKFYVDGKVLDDIQEGVKVKAKEKIEVECKGGILIESSKPIEVKAPSITFVTNQGSTTF